MLAIALVAFKAQVAALFTDQDEVKSLVIYCLPVVAFKYIFDGYQGMLGIGVIPALGMQSVGSKITVLIAYLVTIPVGCLLCFVLGLGVVGLTWGSCISHVIQSTAYAIVILRKDWYEISDKAAQRIRDDNEKQEAVVARQDDDYTKV